MAAAAAAAPTATASASTLTSAVLHTKPLRPITFLRFRTSKNPILRLGLMLGRRNKARGGVGVSDTSSMTELVATSDDGLGRVDVDEVGEQDAILGDGSALDRSEMVSRDLGSILNKMSKWIVAVLFGIVIVWKHDAEILWAAAGSVINAWLSLTLKRMLNHKRPAPHLKSDPGMPSSHAQSIFYGAFFLILSLVHWLGFNALTAIVGTITLGCSFYLTWLRVSQQYHTANQVIVGALLGSTVSITWFWSWHAFILKAFISSIFVRLAVVLSSVISCVIFVLYVIRHWLSDDE